MAINWFSGFIIPIIKITFLGSITIYIIYIIGKAFNKAWSNQTKFIWRYKIRKKPYPEKTVKWCLDAISHGVGYYDAKKLLMIKMINEDQVKETMFIYDQILNELKGGQNGRNFKRFDRKTQISTTAELPTDY